MKRSTTIIICYIAVSFLFIIMLSVFSGFNGDSYTTWLSMDSTVTTKLKPFTEIDFTRLGDSISISNKAIRAEITISDSVEPGVTTVKDIFKVVQKGSKVYIMPTEYGLKALSDYKTTFSDRTGYTDTLTIVINAGRDFHVINAAGIYDVHVHAGELKELTVNCNNSNSNVIMDGSGTIDRLTMNTTKRKDKGKGIVYNNNLGLGEWKVSHLMVNVDYGYSVALADELATIDDLTVRGSGEISSLKKRSYKRINCIPDKTAGLKISYFKIMDDLVIK